jgi:hypothetical protein
MWAKNLLKTEQFKYLRINMDGYSIAMEAGYISYQALCKGLVSKNVYILSD